MSLMQTLVSLAKTMLGTVGYRTGGDVVAEFFAAIVDRHPIAELARQNNLWSFDFQHIHDAFQELCRTRRLRNPYFLVDRHIARGHASAASHAVAGRLAFDKGDMANAERHCAHSLGLQPKNLFTERLHLDIQERRAGTPGELDRWLAGRFCPTLFEQLMVHPGGAARGCCYVPAFYGNLMSEDFESVWRSPVATAMRQGILDGSYRYCQKSMCAAILTRSLPERRPGDGAALPPPTVITLAHDRTCNLSCPSCRSSRYTAPLAEQQQLDAFLERNLAPMLKGARTVMLSGDGDPFASKHYRKIIRTLTAEAYPELRFHLQTNAVLLDPRAWQELGLAGRVSYIGISVDATTEATYRQVRRGGDFHRLMRNLEFIADLVRRNELPGFQLMFVVQEANFQEMPDFVRLGQRLGAHRVIFMLMENWSGTDLATYTQAFITNPGHPRFAAFQAVMADPIFRDPVVELAGLRRFVP